MDCEIAYLIQLRLEEDEQSILKHGPSLVAVIAKLSARAGERFNFWEVECRLLSAVFNFTCFIMSYQTSNESIICLPLLLHFWFWCLLYQSMRCPEDACMNVCVHVFPYSHFPTIFLRVFPLVLVALLPSSLPSLSRRSPPGSANVTPLSLDGGTRQSSATPLGNPIQRYSNN